MRRFGAMALFCCAAVVALSAESVQVTIVSNPPAASVVIGGKSRGLAPVTVKYSMGKECIVADVTVLTWASGAEVSLPVVEVCPKAGKKQTITVLRSPIPGREIDATFALQVKRVATAKQQAALDSYRALLKQQRPLNMDFVNPPSSLRSCRSELRLGTVFTTCTDNPPRPKPYLVETIRSDGPPQKTASELSR